MHSYLNWTLTLLADCQALRLNCFYSCAGHCVAIPQWNICNCLNICCNIMNASHREGTSIHLSVCNWDLLRPFSFFLSPALLHRVPSLLPVLDLLWNPYMVISFSNAFGTGNNFQQQPKKMGKRRMERTPAGQLLIDTHKQAKKMPCNALHWASLRTYTPFAISALNLIYIHFIIFAFSATPTRLRPACSALPCPPLCCLPASLRSDLWQSPLVVFSVTVVPCGANEFKCVRNWVIKISLNSACPNCLPAFCSDSILERRSSEDFPLNLATFLHFCIF